MFRNWQTTLIGFGLAIVNQIASGTNWKTVLASAGMAALGAAAGDAKNQTPTR